MFRRFSASSRQADLSSVLHVAEDKEALFCYQKKGDEAPAGELEVTLRAPLLLATAAQAPGAKHMVSVTLATPEVLKCLEGMQISPGEAHGRFQEAPLLPPAGGGDALTFECGSERSAQQLLDQLSRAGCTLQGLTDRYRLRKEVGRGGFGRVYLAHDTWNGEEVAVKVFLNKTRAKPEQFHPLREATMLRWADDPLFAHFKAVYEVSEREFDEMDLFELGEDGDEIEVISAFALVTEYLPGGELFAFMAQHGPLSEDGARALMQQVLSGLDNLHKRGIMHRDIKPENVLLAGSGNKVKLVDFGLASVVWDAQAAVARVGSVGYIAPEVLTQPSPPQTTQVDCFSAGVLLYTCLAGHGPFQGRHLKEVLVKNLHNYVNVQAMGRFPPGARDLLTQLLETRPEKRPTAQECLQHPWLRRPRDIVSAKVDTLESLAESTSRLSHGCMSEASSSRSLSSSRRGSSELAGLEGPVNAKPVALPQISLDSLSVLAARASGDGACVTHRCASCPRATAGKQLTKSVSLDSLVNGAAHVSPTSVRHALAAGAAGRAPVDYAAGRAALAAGGAGGGAAWAAARGSRPRGSGALAAKMLRVRPRGPPSASDSEGDEECFLGGPGAGPDAPEAARAEADASGAQEGATLLLTPPPARPDAGSAASTAASSSAAAAPAQLAMYHSEPCPKGKYRSEEDAPPAGPVGRPRLSFGGLRQRFAESKVVKGHVQVPRFLLGGGVRPRTAASRGGGAAPEFTLLAP